MSANRANGRKISTGNHVIARCTGLSYLSENRNATDSKYGNRKTILDGNVFDSKHEAYRWIELKYMERIGLITDLKRQVPFELIPNQKKGGKVIERAVKYIADFTYKKKNGDYIVEDAKGVKTDVYKLKKKLMLYVYGIKVEEV